MDFRNIHRKTFHYCLRIIFVLSLLIALLSLINGCSVLTKPSQQPEEIKYKEQGIASYYGKTFRYQKTASGEKFDDRLMTAAHRTLPFGTKVVVKNLNNGKSVKVTINDRGPFIKNRILDLTRGAFLKIENTDKGFAKVEITLVD